MKLTEEIIKQIRDETSCSVSNHGGYYSIFVENSCYEDFTFEINKGKDEIEQIINYCDGFDAGEHFKSWYGVNRGEPSDAEVLMNNCKEIKEHLQELRNLLEEIMFA